MNLEQVMYAVYSIRSHKVYVGFTSNTALHRLHQHIQAARHTQSGLNTQRDYPLSVAIAQSDYRDWRIFPLECIAGAYDTFDAFKAVARPRELFWMRRLHTFLPQGLNQDCPRSTLPLQTST